MKEASLRDQRHRELGKLRKKAAELEKVRAAHGDLGKQINQTISVLNATLESTADGLLVIDNFGKIVNCNKKFLKMWRIPSSVCKLKDEKTLIDFILDQLQDPKEFLRKIHYLYSHPDEESFDVLEFQDGRVFERFSLPQRIGRDIVGRVWSYRNVTERAQTQKALEESKAEFEAIFNSIADAAIFVDTHRRIIMVNPAFTGMFGYGIKELKGKTTRFMYANEADYVRAGKKHYHPGAVHDKPVFECSYRSKDGTLFIAETVATQVMDSKGRLIGFFGIHRDITQRKRIEEALRDSEKRLQRSQEIAHLGSWEFDIVNNILTWSDEVYRIFGLQPREINATYEACLEAMHPDDRAAVDAAYSNSLREGRDTYEIEHRIVRRHSGEIRHVHEKCQHVRDETGRIIRSEGMVQDITERKRAEEAIRDSEEKFRMLLNSAAEAIYGIDTNGKCIICNASFLRQMGYEKEEDVLGKNIHELIHYKRADGTEYPMKECKVFKGFIKGEGVHVDDEVFWRADGSSFSAEYWSYPIEKGGKVIGAVVSLLDISERRRMENALRDSEAKCRSLFTKMLNGFAYHKIIVDEKGVPVDYVFLEVNEAFERMTGLKRRDIVGKKATEVIPGIREAGFDWIGVYGKVALSGKEIVFEQYSPEHDRWYSVSAYCTERGYFGAILEDITERKRMEEEIKHQAYHDTLTGLPNRIVFMDRLDLAITQAHRNKQILALLFLDLDRFKDINDAYGHGIGDQLLKEVSLRLKSCLRETDTVARMGGDEFSVLLGDVKHMEDASRIAGKIIVSIQEPYNIGDYELHMSTSIGISIYPDDSIRPEILLRNADIAMYHAKGQGRSNYQFYSPTMKSRTIERMMFENNLRKALHRGELRVFYQPQVDIATSKMVSAEALVRWQHPELGLLDATQFISMAEKTGLIDSIGEYVLQTVCELNKALQKAGCPPVCVTVNLSAHEFQNPGIIDKISRILRESGLDPHFLELEITESTAMRDAVLTGDKLGKLSEMGILFSLDDFGIGYSSLNYLKKFPIQKLKIDQSFIRGLKEDTDDQAIVNAVVQMAHSLKLSVVAEGVETDDQVSFLRSCQCDQMQGYLYSKPLAIEDFQKFVMSH
jgi:diguanylate cyclase (GGDEF)-like protein/PAS domain S-box-containing protein